MFYSNGSHTSAWKPNIPLFVGHEFSESLLTMLKKYYPVQPYNNSIIFLVLQGFGLDSMNLFIRFVSRRGEAIIPGGGGWVFAVDGCGDSRGKGLESAFRQALDSHQATEVDEGSFFGSTPADPADGRCVLQVLEILSASGQALENPLTLLLNVIWPQSPCLYPLAFPIA